MDTTTTDALGWLLRALLLALLGACTPPPRPERAEGTPVTDWRSPSELWADLARDSETTRLLVREDHVGALRTTALVQIRQDSCTTWLWQRRSSGPDRMVVRGAVGPPLPTHFVAQARAFLCGPTDGGKDGTRLTLRLNVGPTPVGERTLQRCAAYAREEALFDAILSETFARIPPGSDLTGPDAPPGTDPPR